jgi:hypothetical protein
MKILDRLPYGTAPTTVAVAGQELRVRAYQAIVWVSLSVRTMLEWDTLTPRFPAILDTGSNHNFSIGRSHLIQWAGILPEALLPLGTVRERGQRVPVHAAKLWLHPNLPGQNQVAERKPFALDLKGGIALYPDQTAPRLPILGLRALTDNNLYLSIDGQRRRLGIRTLDWRTKLLRLLS